MKDTKEKMSYTRLLQPLCACSLQLLNQKKGDVSIIKEQRKNGGKLTSEALTQKGRTPSTSIKSKHKKKGKKNGKL